MKINPKEMTTRELHTYCIGNCLIDPNDAENDYDNWIEYPQGLINI